MTNIIILYWDTGCHVRNENTKISWRETKKMVESLKERGLNISCSLFEFGRKFYFDDSIKIEMDLDYYERSKKINIALNHEINNDVKFVGIMDSDLFFIEEQYDEIFDNVRELEINGDSKFFTYNLLDIDENQRKQVIVDSEIDLEILNNLKSDFVFRHSWGSGTLGGFFLSPLNKLKDMGGYNENYLTWGAEDDDALTRLKGHCQWSPKMWKGPYHLYHPKNNKDKKYFIQVYTDEYFKINKVEKPR
jgi:predicted glycosyltransferase involved in capsule biosynthesis